MKSIRQILDKGYHVPLVFLALALLFLMMTIHDYRSGIIWTGAGSSEQITLSKNPQEFRMMIGFFALMDVLFWASFLWMGLTFLKRWKR